MPLRQGRAQPLGHVPFGYYLLHIPQIHLVALLILVARTRQATSWLFQDHPVNPGPVPEGYMWSLPLLYGVTALVVIALYFPCRWFAEQQAQREVLVELPLTIAA